MTSAIIDAMEEFERFYNRALRFLSYRPRSEKEIRDYLTGRKGGISKRKVEQADTAFIERIINKLKELNLINDEEFAKWWIEQRTGAKPRGLRLIKMELRQKGISEELIEQVSSIKYQVLSEKDLAKKALERKLKAWGKFPKEVFRQKALAFLLRRGFDFETAKEAIDEIFEKEYTKQWR